MKFGSTNKLARLKNLICKILFFLCTAVDAFGIGPKIIQSNYPDGYVDPRQPETSSNPDPQGISAISVTFSEAVGDLRQSALPGSLAPITIENFDLRFYRNGQDLDYSELPDILLDSPPYVADVTGSGAGPYIISLSQRIALGSWTVLRPVNIVGASGLLLTGAPNNPSGVTRLVLGNHPMDLDQDGKYAFSDWVYWRAYAQGTRSPAPLTLNDYLDIDRSNTLSFPSLFSDIFRARQLLDGPPPLPAWKSPDLNLGAKPAQDCLTNNAPQANFIISSEGDGAFTFNGTSSIDSDITYWEGLVVAYRWNFDDGSSSSWSESPIIQHQYTAQGNFSVTLTISDYCGQENSISQQVSFTRAPELVRDIAPGPFGSFERLSGVSLANFKNALYFNAQYDIWTTDGSEAGTKRVIRFSYLPTPNPANFLYGRPYSFTAQGNNLFFHANLNEYTLSNSQLVSCQQGIWKTDGTEIGTTPVKIFTGCSGGQYRYIYELLPTTSGLFFRAENESYSEQFVWYISGTTFNSSLIAQTSNSYLHGSLGGKALFYSFNEQSPSNEGFWSSDGTSTGTQRFANTGPIPRPLQTPGTSVRNNLYYYAAAGCLPTPNDQDQGLWVTDGTSANTRCIKPTGEYGPVVLSNNSLFFFADENITQNAFDLLLMKSDGTTQGTVKVKKFDSGYIDVYGGPEDMIDVGGTLYFSMSTLSAGKELWKSNGTEGGTIQVRDIFPGTTGSNPHDFVNVNGILYFVANNGSAGEELWRSDGTSEGTVMVADLKANGSSSPEQLTAVSNTLYFIADDGVHGLELWKY